MAMAALEWFLVICFSLVAAVTLVVLEQWLSWLRLKLRHNQQPPGPIPIPILGNLLLLISSTAPHRYLAELARQYYGPLLYLQLGTVPTVIVSSPSAAHQVLHAHDKSLASRPSFISVSRLLYDIHNIAFMCPYNDHWRWNRKFYSLHMFHSPHHQQIHARVFHEEILRAIMGDVYAASHAGSQVNLSKLFSTIVQNIMYRIVVDKLPSDISTTTTDVHSLTREAERLVSVTRIGEFVPFLSFLDRRLNGAIDRCHRAMDAVLEGVIAERERMKKNNKKSFDSNSKPKPFPSDDGEGTQDCMLDAMLASDPPMDRSKMKAMILELTIGGNATTATALEWAMAELLNNERVMRKAVEEVDRVVGKERMVSLEDVRRDKKKKMPYIEAVVKETLRLHPSAPLLLPHLATEPCNITLLQQKSTTGADHGSTFEVVHRIAAGTRVMVNAWAIGRDEATWGPTANEFAPERFLAMVDGAGLKREVVDVMGQDFGLLPFGSGRRMCPGYAMALSMLELTIATFLHCFEWKTDETPLDMSEEFGLNLIRRSQLHALPTSFRLLSTPTCV